MTVNNGLDNFYNLIKFASLNKKKQVEVLNNFFYQLKAYKIIFEISTNLMKLRRGVFL